MMMANFYQSRPGVAVRKVAFLLLPEFSQLGIAAATEPLFVANWLAEQKLDPASGQLLELGREIYKTFFKSFKDLPTAKYKVEHWDAGWWQIKRCLVEAGLEAERLDEIEEIKKHLSAEINKGTLDLGIITSVDLF